MCAVLRTAIVLAIVFSAAPVGVRAETLEQCVLSAVYAPGTSLSNLRELIERPLAEGATFMERIAELERKTAARLKPRRLSNERLVQAIEEMIPRVGMKFEGVEKLVLPGLHPRYRAEHVSDFFVDYPGEEMASQIGEPITGRQKLEIFEKNLAHPVNGGKQMLQQMPSERIFARWQKGFLNSRLVSEFLRRVRAGEITADTVREALQK